MNIGYGPDPNQFIRIHRPDSAEVVAVVVLVHGGFFKQEYNIDNSAIDALIPALISNDLAVCMLEYRRVGGGGGYPFTNDDIISGLNKLSSVRDDLRLGPSVLVGHSAGGTLVLWVCCESNMLKLKASPILCIALAPIGDLEEGQRRRLSDNGDAIFKYMGELPKDDPDQASAYKLSSPHNLLPLQVETVLVAGRKDMDVPSIMIRQFYENMSDKSNVEYIEVDGNHFDLVNPCIEPWAICLLNKIKTKVRGH